ncbi:hypothetical protein GALL_342140 [mine drainage metagenome]|uniref:Uncharacterized protein n=1 Tax=mine drainage metagenome TaxID=410659 RepID=A0A1J5QKA7_9ZZZZ
MILDAFRDDVEAEVTREIDRRSHDHRARVVAHQVGHEGPVDLEPTDGQLLQVRQGRVPGAVVVDGDLDAEVGETRQHLDRAHRIHHRDRLGDLELEARRLDAVPAERRADVLHQMLVQEIPHRQVHRDVQLEPVTAPPSALVEAAVEDEQRHRADETGALGRRDERGRTEEPVLRVLPTHESLDADHATRRRLDLGLVVDHELVVVEGVRQLGHQDRREHPLTVHRGHVPRHAAGSGPG